MSSNSSTSKGLQSCLNPLSQKPDSSFLWPENRKDDSFLQAFKSISYDFRHFPTESDQVCVNPFTKCTSLLTTRRLEMCTETLGNETGSSINLNLDEYSYLLSEKQSSNRTKPIKTREYGKKTKHSFPPPLSSINGGNRVEVRALRGGGRLVITADSLCGSRSCFKTERENGRLRLFVVKDDYVSREGELCEKVVEDGGKFSCRCTGEGSGGKKLPSLPVCVAIS